MGLQFSWIALLQAISSSLLYVSHIILAWWFPESCSHAEWQGHKRVRGNIEYLAIRQWPGQPVPSIHILLTKILSHMAKLLISKLEKHWEEWQSHMAKDMMINSNREGVKH